MSQQTFTPSGTQVAEPPAPVLPGDAGGTGDDNRRKLMVVGAAVGVLVLAIVAFFLMKGGSSNKDASFTPSPIQHSGIAAAPAKPAVVKLPRQVSAPVGRDPFKALYVAPAAGPAGGSASSTTTQSSSSGTSSTTTTAGGTTTSTTTTAKATYHPVWVQLKGVPTTSATFVVGYSNGKTLKAVQYSLVKPLRTFAGSFELLSIRNGEATLKYGDGSPFTLDSKHNFMVVG